MDPACPGPGTPSDLTAPFDGEGWGALSRATGPGAMADRMGQAKLPRATRVKSKQAADRQVSHFRQTEGEDDDDG